MNCGDYHIHSKYSYDCDLELETIIKMALKRGLKTIAITDHDTIQGGLEAKRINNSDLEIIIGAEIYTDKGEAIGLGLKEEIKSRKLSEAVQEIKDQGGKVYIPHPFDRLRRKSALGEAIYEILEHIDYIEGFNGRCILNSFNRNAIQFAKEHNIALLAGSDAHFAFEIGNIMPGLSSFISSTLGFSLTKLFKILQESKSSYKEFPYG
jgi:predicted metal-dependent phosphoesterase TrpH